MNKNMSEYTEEVEDKLERAYGALGAQGAKKYGFDKASAKQTDFDVHRSDNWELNRMKKQASSYLSKAGMNYIKNL